VPRLTDLPLLLVVTTRPTTEAPALDVVRSASGSTRLAPAPLSSDAVSALARTAGVEALDEAQRDALWADTGGNPFYLVELLRAGRHTPPPSGGASLPQTIHRAVEQRIGPDGTDTRRVAEAIAILGEAPTVEVVAAVAELEVPAAVTAMRRMTADGVLEHARLAFSHPIVRSSVYDAVPAVIRERLHHLAAQVLRSSGAEATAIASQLLRTRGRGEDATVAVLRSAARVASAQGDPPSARRYLERALEEPPGEAVRGPVHLELAGALAALGAPEADEHYDRGLAQAAAPHERAQARLAQGHALIATGRWQDAARAFERGLEDAGGRDIELTSRLEAGFVSSALVGLVDRDQAAERLARILGSPLTDPAHRELVAWLAFQHSVTVSASASESAALARRAISGVPLETLVRGTQVIELAAGALVAAGELDAEITMLDDAMKAAQRIGAYGKAAIYAYCRSLAHLLSGRIVESIADSQAAVAAHEQGWEVFYPGTCASLSQALLERGEIDAAEQAIALDDDRWRQRLDFQFMVPIARGRVRMARGDHAGAVRELSQAKEAGEQLGLSSPSILADWRTWYAVGMARIGNQDAADRVAGESLDLADRWGAPVARARALWAAGIVAGGGGIEQLREACTIAETTSAALLEAGMRVDLGAALRRAGRTVEAREELGLAADLAHRIGATVLLQRARDELAAAGTRPRRYAVRGIESLTPSELRVSRLAAEGRTNREVAQALYVTPKAVEYHLANAYRKLQIAGRGELAGALHEGASAEVASG
jgi:DNA-binding CsgD family transcriptional regulator/predicted negative regulator of RcsB-dependent stress response